MQHPALSPAILGQPLQSLKDSTWLRNTRSDLLGMTGELHFGDSLLAHVEYYSRQPATGMLQDTAISILVNITQKDAIEAGTLFESLRKHCNRAYGPPRGETEAPWWRSEGPSGPFEIWLRSDKQRHILTLNYLLTQ